MCGVADEEARDCSREQTARDLTDSVEQRANRRERYQHPMEAHQAERIPAEECDGFGKKPGHR